MPNSVNPKAPSLLHGLKKLVAPFRKKPAAAPVPGTKEYAIVGVMQKTGWNRAATVRQIEEAKARLGITYTQYNSYNFHLVPVSRQAEEFVRIQEDAAQKKKQREALAAQEAKETESHISAVMAATGWDRDTTIGKMEQAEKENGVHKWQYHVFRFWELTSEQQKTYFTKGVSDRLHQKFNTDQNLLKIIRSKHLTCQKMEPWLGRPWLAAADMTPELFAQRFAGEEKIIYKPLSSFGGNGIQVFPITQETLADIYHTIEAFPPGLIEGYLQQHSKMQTLSCKSVNTIRVVTIMTQTEMPGLEKGRIYFLYAGLRMGRGSSYVDNLHNGGLIAHVDLDTGILDTDAVDYKTGVSHSRHPDTNTVIKGFQIPCFQEVKQMIREAGKDFPGYLGWDIAISSTGPVVIELNSRPGASCLQVPFVPQGRGMRHIADPFL